MVAKARSAGKRLLIVALIVLLPSLVYGQISLLPADAVNLQELGTLLGSADNEFPTSAKDIATWSRRQVLADKVALTGGAYWLYATVRHDSNVTEWVVDPNNTIIDRVEVRIFGPDGAIQRLESGYQYDYQYMLHYGKRVRLQPGVDYSVVIRFSSPYYASFPRFEILPERLYQRKVINENVLILGALGAIAALMFFNLFLFSLTRDRSQLYYALYLVWFFLGWAFVFNLPAHLFGVRNLNLHYIAFFLLSPLRALFCIDFLKLDRHYPRLAKAVYAVGAISLALLPTSFLALPYAHLLATMVIAIWLPLSMVAGVLCWRMGYRPARFYVLAFVMLIFPAAVILPANLGLMSDVVDNAELLTLLGGTLDAMLLAFALADKIKLLQQEKDGYLKRLDQALKLAHTDSLTGIGNRYAFDQMFDQALKLSFMNDDTNQPLLVLVDLDGLKLVNDKYGHSRGDDLLCSFAGALKGLEDDSLHCFRLGGDEFAIFARRRNEPTIVAALAEIERLMHAQGFAESGVSFGIAYAAEAKTRADFFNAADLRMYEHKATRKSARHALVTQIAKTQET
jgi:diguanylate cyclase (GGDEF)-like protein